MNSISKIGLKGVVIGVAIQVVAMPVMAEEIHGQLTNTWQGNPEDFNLLMGVGINPAGYAKSNVAFGKNVFGDIEASGGSWNVAVGNYPLYSNENGGSNIAIGNRPLFSNKAGRNNIAIGGDSLKNLTHGSTNIAIGLHALDETTVSAGNIAIGHRALGETKIKIKEQKALELSVTALGPRLRNNVAIGNSSMLRHEGMHNVAIGDGSLSNVFGDLQGKGNGNFNVAIGSSAGYASKGNANVFIGNQAGGKVRTGNGNVLIGNKAGWMLPMDASNRLVVANGEYVKDQLIIGNFLSKRISLLGKVKVAGPINAQSFNTTSDARLKNDIQPISDALSSVLQLQGKSYRWNEDEDKQDIGLIAQDVEQIFPQLVAEDGNGFKAIAYSRLTAVLVEAIKEQQGQIESLQQENRELKSRIDSELSLLLSRVSVLEGVPLAQR